MASERFKTWYALSFALQLGFIVVIPIAGLMFLGLWGDKIFRSFPLFLLVGVVAGLAVTTYGVYRFLLPLIDHD